MNKLTNALWAAHANKFLMFYETLPESNCLFVSPDCVCKNLNSVNFVSDYDFYASHSFNRLCLRAINSNRFFINSDNSWGYHSRSSEESKQQKTRRTEDCMPMCPNRRINE